MTSRLRARGPVTVLLVVALAGTACGGSDDAAEPDAATPSSSPTTPDESTTPEPEPEPAEPTSTSYPGITPASGPELAVRLTSLHVPEGWKRVRSITADDVSAMARDGSADVQLIEQANAADVGLEQLAKVYVMGKEDWDVERLDDVRLGHLETEALHVRYTMPGDDRVHHAVLTTQAGSSVTVNFSADPTALRRDPDLFDSILASLVWQV